MIRGLALFLGIFTLLNLAGDSRFDVNLWWIDLSPLLPRGVAIVTLLAFAVAMIALAFGKRNAVTTALTIAMLIASIANTVGYYVVLARGEIHAPFPVPLSLLIAAALSLILVKDAPTTPVFVPAFIAAALIFPLAQISLFGFTDYRRSADVIVVFGATGSPLYDRVRTACELYAQGLAPKLLFSGGPGEPAMMRRYALKHGVPARAIVEDDAGVNTESTVRNTVGMTRGRILAVSHFYHLPRIKMTFQRYGSDVFTVPSGTTDYAIMPFQLAREDAAFWTYYLRRFRTNPQSASR